jgi:hypothetical protein
MKAKRFDEYVAMELKKSINENMQKYGYTSECKENIPYCVKHSHDYIVDDFGRGWTGPANHGNAHVHQIIEGNVVAEGDGHTHELLKPVETGLDGSILGNNKVILTNPTKGYAQN